MTWTPLLQYEICTTEALHKSDTAPAVQTLASIGQIEVKVNNVYGKGGIDQVLGFVNLRHNSRRRLPGNQGRRCDLLLMLIPRLWLQAAPFIEQELYDNRDPDRGPEEPSLVCSEMGRFR